MVNTNDISVAIPCFFIPFTYYFSAIKPTQSKYALADYSVQNSYLLPVLLIQTHFLSYQF